MEERGRREVLHRQTRKFGFKVFSFFRREVDAGWPIRPVAVFVGKRREKLYDYVATLHFIFSLFLRDARLPS